MNYAAVGFLGLLLAPGWSGAAPPGGWGHAPTRLQLCQQEVQGEPDQQRKRSLRDCLTRRMEGEQMVAGECQRQLRLPARRSAAQQKQLRDCEARALALPSSQLPRRPVIVAPARLATPATSPWAPAAAPATAPAVRSPPPPRATPVSSGREGA